MSIQKKSLLSGLNATKKAIVASSTTTSHSAPSVAGSVSARVTMRVKAPIVSRVKAPIMSRVKAPIVSRVKAPIVSRVRTRVKA
jgi:hypothetical protein